MIRAVVLASLIATAPLAAAAEPRVVPDGELRGDPDARGFAELLFAQGRLAWIDADAETALARFDRASSAWPEDATYAYFAGLAELRLRRPGDAVERFSRALPPAKSRIPAWRVHADLGKAQYLNADPDAAEPQLRRALELEPGDPSALFHLGLVLVDLGRGAEAVGMFEEAREQASGLTPDSHYYVGVVAFRRGDFDEAREEFRKALESSRSARHSIPEIRSDARRYLEMLESPAKRETP